MRMIALGLFCFVFAIVFPACAGPQCPRVPLRGLVPVTEETAHRRWEAIVTARLLNGRPWAEMVYKGPGYFLNVPPRDLVDVLLPDRVALALRALDNRELALASVRVAAVRVSVRALPTEGGPSIDAAVRRRVERWVAQRGWRVVPLQAIEASTEDTVVVTAEVTESIVLDSAAEGASSHLKLETLVEVRLTSPIWGLLASSGARFRSPTPTAPGPSLRAGRVLGGGAQLTPLPLDAFYGSLRRQKNWLAQAAQLEANGGTPSSGGSGSLTELIDRLDEQVSRSVRAVEGVEGVLGVAAPDGLRSAWLMTHQSPSTVDALLGVVHELSGPGVTPDRFYDHRVLPAIRGLGLVGDRRAIPDLKAIEAQPGTPPEVYAETLLARARCGDSSAVDIARTMLLGSGRIDGVNATIAAAVAGGDSEELRKFLLRVLSSRSRAGDYSFLPTVIEALVRYAKPEDIHKVASIYSRFRCGMHGEFVGQELLKLMAIFAAPGSIGTFRAWEEAEREARAHSIDPAIQELLALLEPDSTTDQGKVFLTLTGLGPPLDGETVLNDLQQALGSPRTTTQVLFGDHVKVELEQPAPVSDSLRRAIYDVRTLNTEGSRQALEALLTDPSTEVRRTAALSLASYGKDAVPALRENLTSGGAEVDAAAVALAIAMGRNRVVEGLRKSP